MIEQFLRDPKTIQRMNEGTLGSFIKTYARHLYDNGYSRQSSCYQLRLIASFSKWLHQQRIQAKDINNQQIDRYLKYRKRFLNGASHNHYDNVPYQQIHQYHFSNI